jgi:hypothetical protein
MEIVACRRESSRFKRNCNGAEGANRGRKQESTWVGVEAARMREEAAGKRCSGDEGETGRKQKRDE